MKKIVLFSLIACLALAGCTSQQIQPDFIGKDLPDAVRAIYHSENGESDILDDYRFRCQLSCD